MSANVILFPQRAPFAVRVEREGPAWLVTCRSHAWLHGSHHEAVTDAKVISRGFGVVVNHYQQFNVNSRKRANRLMSVDAATAAIAHEIKQPLAAISVRGSTALRWLKRTPPDCEEAITCLTGLMEASGRANEVVDRTRELFKTTDHQNTLIEINRLVRQVLRMVEYDLRGQGVTVSTEFQEGLPQIMGDPTLLQQVILNLVKNAIEAMGTVPRTKKSSSAGNDP
jgi:nitrogen-specific signal transduction histidine kinase